MLGHHKLADNSSASCKCITRPPIAPDALTVSPDGKLSIGIRMPTWRPSDKYGSDDRRDLGLR